MSLLTSWIDICPLTDIAPNSGVCADLNGQQVALFHLFSNSLTEESSIKAVSNFDPYSKANVLSRGLITEKENNYFIASPLLKQQFCLETGISEQDNQIAIDTFQARIHQGTVQLMGRI